MRQSASRAVREGPKHGRRSSFAEMQARIDILEAELVRVRSIELANQSDHFKFSASHTLNLHNAGAHVLEQGVQ